MLLFQISNPDDILVKPQHHHLIPVQQITGQSSQATNQSDKLHSSCQALNLHFKAWGTSNSCHYSHFLLWKIHLPRSFMPSIIVIKASLSYSQSEHQHMETTKVPHRYTLSFLASKVKPDMMQLQHTTWASLLSVLIANGGGNWWTHFDSGQQKLNFLLWRRCFRCQKNSILPLLQLNS